MPGFPPPAWTPGFPDAWVSPDPAAWVPSSKGAVRARMLGFSPCSDASVSTCLDTRVATHPDTRVHSSEGAVGAWVPGSHPTQMLELLPLKTPRSLPSQMPGSLTISLVLMCTLRRSLSREMNWAGTRACLSSSTSAGWTDGEMEMSGPRDGPPPHARGETWGCPGEPGHLGSLHRVGAGG